MPPRERQSPFALTVGNRFESQLIVETVGSRRPDISSDRLTEVRAAPSRANPAHLSDRAHHARLKLLGKCDALLCAIGQRRDAVRRAYAGNVLM